MRTLMFRMRKIWKCWKFMLEEDAHSEDYEIKLAINSLFCTGSAIDHLVNAVRNMMFVVI